MQNNILRAVTFFSLYGLLIFSGCGEATLQSNWQKGEIKIDGSDGDWGSNLLLFEKEKIAVGVSNDDENLYLCIKCMDRSLQQQIVRAGFTVWIDSSGSDNKIFGVHFPVGIQTGDMPKRSGERTDDGSGNEMPREMDRDFFRRMYEMEVMGGENMVLEKFQNLHPSGMQLAISDSTGPIVYEIKVPFRTHPGQRYAIGTDPGRTIGIGFETGEFRKRVARQESSDEMSGEGGRRGGGMRGGGGRRGGGGGGMRGGGQGDNGNEPTKLWAKIHLASSTPSGN